TGSGAPRRKRRARASPRAARDTCASAPGASRAPTRRRARRRRSRDRLLGVGGLAFGQAEEQLFEARGLGHERGHADLRLAERDRERRHRLFVSLEADRAVDAGNGRDSWLGEAERARALVVGGAEAVAARGGREQVAERTFVDDPACANDRDPVAELLDLAE